jgi:hypothetical protein
MMQLHELIDLNQKTGQHFFAEGAVRFFKSVIEHFDPCSEFFVTSEAGPLGGKRLFTLRHYDPETGRVSTVGNFQAYKSKESAWKARLELLDDNNN